MVDDSSAWSETRLAGTLALDAGSTVDSLLVLSLASRQVLFHRNLNDPTSAAVASFDAYSASAKLSSSSSSTTTTSDEQSPVPKPLLLKLYTPAAEGALRFYKAIYSDGTYLLCADVSTAPPTQLP